jgi:hypothetical protein
MSNRRITTAFGMAAISLVLSEANLALADCGGYWPGAISIMSKLNRGLVKIETSGGPDKPCKNEGSGFIISSSPSKIVIATAKHVISSESVCVGPMEIFGRLVARPDVELPLTIERRGESDIILLSISTETVKAAFGATSPACRFSLGTVGTPPEQLLLLGYFPGDRTPVPGAGQVETQPDEGGTRQRICGAINHGLSGGPVVDQRGEVLGLMRERLEKDSYGNEVVEKGFILPVNSIDSEIRKVSSPQGELCFSPSITTASVTSAQERVTIPYQLSELRDDHIAAPADDLAKWTANAIIGNKPAPLRYPKQYQRVYPAIAGYRITSIRETRTASHNFPDEPLPTTACASEQDCIRIAPDGRSVIVNFRLWSGPSVDQTRGWLDMSIITEQALADPGAVELPK